MDSDQMAKAVADGLKRDEQRKGQNQGLAFLAIVGGIIIAIAAGAAFSLSFGPLVLVLFGSMIVLVTTFSMLGWMK